MMGFLGVGSRLSSVTGPAKSARLALLVRMPSLSMVMRAMCGLMNSRWMRQLHTSSRTMTSRALLRCPPSSTKESGSHFSQKTTSSSYALTRLLLQTSRSS